MSYFWSIAVAKALAMCCSLVSCLTLIPPLPLFTLAETPPPEKLALPIPEKKWICPGEAPSINVYHTRRLGAASSLGPLKFAASHEPSS